MDSPFGSSLAVVDLDGDGLHDRIYAGDRAGRLWRMDLSHGAPLESWMQARILADLGARGRGFLAAPDIAIMEAADGSKWINIAIGTASVGPMAVENRFFVVRDTLHGSGPTIPLREADLAALTAEASAPDQRTPGFFLSIGQAQILAPALTLHGRIHFTMAEDLRTSGPVCPTGKSLIPTASISALALDATDGHSVSPPHRLGVLPANIAILLSTDAVSSDGRQPCRVGTEILPGCFLDTRPQRRWWRREDAD